LPSRLRKLRGMYYNESRNWINKGYLLLTEAEFKPVESLAEVKDVDILDILPFYYLSFRLNAEVVSSLILLLFSIKSDRKGVLATNTVKLMKHKSVKSLLLKSSLVKFL